MPQNYTLTTSMSMTASSATGYSQSQSGAYTLNITGVDQIETGRKDVTHDGDVTIIRHVCIVMYFSVNLE